MMNSRLIKVVALVALLALVAGAASGEGPTARRHDFPRVGPYQVLTGDFHMHTINSDGKLTTRQRVEESYELGYDVICVTDHGKTRAYRIANYVGTPLGLVVLRGLETGLLKEEHMNAIGVSERYVPRDPHKWSETPGGETVYYQDELRRIANYCGIVIYNHPHVGYREPLLWGVKQGLIEGIEVKNDVVGSKWNSELWNGIYCYPGAFDFALEHNLTLFANTDAHGKRNDNPAVTLIFATGRTIQAVKEAFRERRTAAWFEGVIWGREALLSDLVKATVKITRTANGIEMENLGPVALKATLLGAAEKAVDLPAYQKTAVEWADPSTTLNVRWDNVWTSPKTNLQTAFGL